VVQLRLSLVVRLIADLIIILQHAVQLLVGIEAPVDPLTRVVGLLICTADNVSVITAVPALVIVLEEVPSAVCCVAHNSSDCGQFKNLQEINMAMVVVTFSALITSRLVRDFVIV